MPKEQIISQLEEEGPWQGESFAETERRVLRRIVLEILPWIGQWAQEEENRKDSLTKKAIQDTLRNKENFTGAEASQWKNILEEFCQRNIEVIILRQPLELDGLFRVTARASKETKNPLIKRLLELEDSAEDTIVIGWHINHGCIAATMPDINSNCRQFPERQKWLTWRLQETRESEMDSNMDLRSKSKKTLTLWAWDRKNFST
jgi:hypothetical protein